MLFTFSSRFSDAVSGKLYATITTLLCSHPVLLKVLSLLLLSPILRLKTMDRVDVKVEPSEAGVMTDVVADLVRIVVASVVATLPDIHLEPGDSHPQIGRMIHNLMLCWTARPMRELGPQTVF